MNYLYLLRAVDGGPIKIGVTADPARRLSVMQAGCPVRLEYVALAKREHSYKDENFLHKKYKDLRLHGEWFEPSEDLLGEIKAIGMNDFP